MKPIHKLALAALSAALLNLSTSHGAIVIPGADGSDGVLNITNNTVIDLSQAITGSWDTNNSANAGKGIYDSNKWAVVFKYSSVNISTGATVTFANHGSRAPVVWLVNGDVTVNGVLSLDGQAWQRPPELAEPGPGGFRGGFGSFTVGVDEGPGFGPGGGQNVGIDRYGGSYGTLGFGGSATYGNPSLLPLIGGSGGSGDIDGTTTDTGSGGGGGGAILLACTGTLSIGNTGSIRANGGNGGTGGNNVHSAGGSGGGIRLVCNSLSGSGIISALAGGGYRAGGLGRIRIERVINANSLQVTPGESPITLAAGSTPLIWLPSDGPTARIVSIGNSGNTNAPADPRASFGTFGADVTLPQVSTAPVIIETTNAESASIVRVRVTPRANGSYTETTATLTQTNSTNPLVLRWLANVPVNPGYSAVQVRVVRP